MVQGAWYKGVTQTDGHIPTHRTFHEQFKPPSKPQPYLPIRYPQDEPPRSAE